MSPSSSASEAIQFPRPLSAVETEISAASNRFTFDLLAKAGQPNTNLVLSPLSASMALGMTLNGAAGETARQIRAMLGLSGLTQDEVNNAYESLINFLVSVDPAVETAIGNSLWIRQGFPVYPIFLNTVRQSFDAEAAELDFADAGAPERINKWGRATTNGRIETIVPDLIPSSVVMYLINTIYFKGQWSFPFDPSETQTEPFKMYDGSVRTVSLMSAWGYYPYLENDRFQAVDLPYGNGAFSLSVLLPRPGVSAHDLSGAFDAEEWRKLADGFRETGLILFLPRFQMSSERKLNDDLIALGMVDAFDQQADFAKLSPASGLWISEVKQKARVEVNEKGTEAAAATSVAMTESVKPVFRADRPFLFFIRERFSDTILFAGKFAHPPDQSCMSESELRFFAQPSGHRELAAAR